MHPYTRWQRFRDNAIILFIIAGSLVFIVGLIVIAVFSLLLIVREFYIRL